MKDKDAVVIYLSDHGDECHDFRNNNGRMHDLGAYNGKVAEYQLDIPFTIYLSDEFIKNNPDMERRIKLSLDRPFMTDNLSHLIMELAGIQSSYFKADRSLINPNYDVSRERILYNEGCIYSYDTKEYISK